ncbi:MAG: 3-isopropylmalate dehydratase small subunit [Desulfobacterales bacterium]|jgi:3-isopropylmalate/(R)-2-methylmalate dehydratase small subunit
MKVYEGRVLLLPDDVNTDYIISSRRKRDTLDLNVLKNYLMEDIDPDFAGRVQPGDIIAAGDNFGCGSAMEVASLVILAAGITIIVAKSFARTFYRNAVNGGLLTIEADTADMEPMDRLRIEVGHQEVAIRNLTKNTTAKAVAPSGMLMEIFSAGGLVEYIRKYGDFPDTHL